MTEDMIVMQAFLLYVFGILFCTVFRIVDEIIDRRKKKRDKPED